MWNLLSINIFFVAGLYQCHALLIGGKSMSIDAAITEAGAKNRMTKLYELMQDENTVLVELDMTYRIKDYAEMKKRSMTSSQAAVKKREKRKAIIPLNFRWSNNRIPYEISSELSTEERQLIMSAVAEYHKFSCVRFVPATVADKNKVKIQNGGGCSSFVGMIGGTQELNLAAGCRYKGIIIHEMGHALGFQHEQTRSDRDSFVSIATSNIQSGLEYNFVKYSETQVDNHGVPYDYSSVMHYSQYAFSRNGLPTIQARDPKFQDVMGNRDGLSFKDIHMLNSMYKCSEKNGCQLKSCPPGGFQGPDCKCWCDSGDRGNPVKECAKTVQAISSTASTVTTASFCEDENIYCSYWANAGECYRNPLYMRSNCRKSCQLCKSVTTVRSCQDVSSLCIHWRSYCRDYVYSGYLQIKCAHTCGYCDSTTVAKPAKLPTTKKPPQNLKSDCADASPAVYCGKRLDQCGTSVVRNRCRMTCKAC